MSADAGPSSQSGPAGSPAAEAAPASLTEQIRQFWDADAEVYDSSPDHYPRRAPEQAAWAGTLRRLLPEPPAAVLDVGAGTGFLSLLLAGQGYDVTALDLSPAMLARLQAKAAERGLTIRTVAGEALTPPPGDFAAVVERHLVWTLPDPAGALAAWHQVAPNGRLVLVEGSWGPGQAASLDGIRAAARHLARQVTGHEPGHHGEYSPQVRSALPHSDGLSTQQVVDLVQASGWGQARLERLRDVEWAYLDGRSVLDQLLGTTPRWAVVAGY